MELVAGARREVPRDLTKYEADFLQERVVRRRVLVRGDLRDQWALWRRFFWRPTRRRTPSTSSR